MPEFSFTKAQKAATDIRGRNILVSAGAGSGKTRTLTQRVIELLTSPDNPADISEMLIVTFTVSAADELRSRITSALTSKLISNPGNAHLASQLTKIGSAQISTIDSFYNSVIKDNFQALNIPLNLRIAESGETLAMKTSLMNDIVNRRFGENPDFRLTADLFTGPRSDSGLEEKLLEIHDFTEKQPDGAECLRKWSELCRKEADMPYFETRSGKIVRDYLLYVFSSLLDSADYCRDASSADEKCVNYIEDFDILIGYIRKFISSLEAGDYSGAHDTAMSFSPRNTGRVIGKASENSVAIRKERARITDSIKELSENYLSFSPGWIRISLNKSSDICSVIYGIIREFGETYSEKKLGAGIIEFSDLRKYAYRLLVNEDGTPTETAKAVGHGYSHIFVDEYQDTDSVQDMIFRSISDGHNLFIVGDIKQSIYMFRGAEPDFFASYRRNWPAYSDENADTDTPCAVYMSENFRCSENIIKFANLICRSLFTRADSREGFGIGYKPEDDLIFSKTGPVSDDKVKIVIAEKTENREDSDNAPPPDALYILSEIRRIVKEDRRPDGSRYSYGDIAVLTPTHKVSSYVSELLSSEGIPYYDAEGELMFRNPEVLLFFSIMCSVDNPQHDIPLCAAMKSPFFGFTLDDLVRIRTGNRSVSLYDSVCGYAAEGDDSALAGKCSQFIDKINSYREYAMTETADRFVRKLWKDSSAMTYAGSDRSSCSHIPSERRKNLRKLYDFALKYKASSFMTLHDFVVYIKGLIDTDTIIRTDDPGSADCVRIMTVHKSKGLEFPIVFLCGVSSRFNNEDSKNNCIVTSSFNLGLCTRIPDETGLIMNNTPMRSAALAAIAEKNRDEYIRLLYVALTRPVDRLYVVGKAGFGKTDTLLGKAEELRRTGDRMSVRNSSCLLDMILTSLAGNSSPDCCTLETLRPVYSDSGSPGTATEESPLPDSELTEAIRRKISFRYPHSSLSDIPAKLSVSALYPGIMDESDGIASLEKLSGSLGYEEPEFGGTKDSPALKGTATHLFLQFCDFSKLDGSVQAVKEEARRLSDLGFVPEEYLPLIRNYEIAVFTKSPIFDRIIKSKDVNREYRFNVFIPASEFITDENLKESVGDEKLLIQGVIDIFFTDSEGKTVLCDYKTDRFTREQLADESLIRAEMIARHGMQLEYYAKAIGILYGKEPDEMILFPLHYGKEIRISKGDLRNGE